MGSPAAGAAREGPSTQALHVAAQRLCEGEASPSILPKAATLGRSQPFPFTLLQCLKSSRDGVMVIRFAEALTWEGLPEPGGAA